MGIEITGMLAVGNGEKCPFCKTILDDRSDREGENIFIHLNNNHKTEFLNAVGGKENNEKD